LKYAFTTLGCPKWDLETVVANARKMGFDGIDFRGLGPHTWDSEAGTWANLDMDITRNPLFTTGLATTKQLISDAGLEVSAVSTGAFLARKDAASALDEARRYIDLAAALDSGIVRVFGGSYEKQGLSPEDARTVLAENLSTLAAQAEDAGVTVALETHDAWIDARDVKAVMDMVESAAIGVLWDTHHPYRLKGEPPETTWELLGDRIVYTHVKDSREDPTNPRTYQLCDTGEGTIPLAGIVEVLKNGGYDGYLTLEWEKMWAPELPEPELAFPQYLAVMKELVE